MIIWEMPPINLYCKIQKLSEYLPSMKLDGYLFELCQERVDK